MLNEERNIVYELNIKHKHIKPFPDKLKNERRKRARKIYKNVLKETGNYSLYWAAVCAFISFLDKIGFTTVSYVKSLIIFNCIAVVAVGGVTAGSYYVVNEIVNTNEEKKIILPKESIEKDIINKNTSVDAVVKPVVKTASKEKKEITPPKYKPTVAITPFKLVGDINKKYSKLVAKDLASNLPKDKYIYTTKYIAGIKTVLDGIIVYEPESKDYTVFIKIIDPVQKVSKKTFHVKFKDIKNIKSIYKEISSKIKKYDKI
jgi:hypothetical protein